MPRLTKPQKKRSIDEILLADFTTKIKEEHKKVSRTYLREGYIPRVLSDFPLLLSATRTKYFAERFITIFPPIECIDQDDGFAITDEGYCKRMAQWLADLAKISRHLLLDDMGWYINVESIERYGWFNEGDIYVAENIKTIFRGFIKVAIQQVCTVACCVYGEDNPGEALALSPRYVATEVWLNKHVAKVAEVYEKQIASFANDLPMRLNLELMPAVDTSKVSNELVIAQGLLGTKPASVISVFANTQLTMSSYHKELLDGKLVRLLNKYLQVAVQLKKAAEKGKEFVVPEVKSAAGSSKKGMFVQKGRGLAVEMSKRSFGRKRAFTL